MKAAACTSLICLVGLLAAALILSACEERMAVTPRASFPTTVIRPTQLLAMITLIPDTATPFPPTLPASTRVILPSDSPVTPTITAAPSELAAAQSVPSGPTRTPRPTRTPGLPPTSDPTSDATSVPVNGITPLPVVPAGLHQAVTINIDSHLRSIFDQGQVLGNDPAAFSRIGDSVTVSHGYLFPFYFGEYELGEYHVLQPTIWYFAPSGSFGRVSAAAWDGAGPEALFDPTWANRAVCNAEESPLDCELRIQRPSIVLIFLRAWDGHGEAGSAYDHAMRRIVQLLLDRGMIPVLSTVPTPTHDPQFFDPMNATLRQIAADFDIPLWDLHHALATLPNRGLIDDLHFTTPPDGQTATFTTDYIEQYGEVVHNLEALEVLTAILNEAIR